MNVRMTDGLLSECYNKIRENILSNISVDEHIATYVGEHGETYAEPEFTGKYMDICAQYVKREGKASPFALNAERVIDSVLSNQKSDGDISCLQNGEGWFSVWNQTFTVIGMLSYYDITKDEKILSSVMKCADRIVRKYSGEHLPAILDTVNDGSEHLPFLLPLILLWQRTGKTEYLDFINEVLEYLETTDMNLLSFDNILKLRSRKGIEMLIIYLGIAEIGRVIGEKRYIDAAARYWKQVNTSQIRNTGNGTTEEMWTENGNAPANIPTELKPNETCVAVGFIELAMELYDVYGESVYLDAVEKTLYNHILGAMDVGGRDFAYYQGNLGIKIFRKAGGLYQCCRYRGYSLFAHIPDMLYRFDGETVTPLIYSSSELCDEGIELVQRTDYPVSGTVDFDVKNRTPIKLKLRIPNWCREYTVRLNGSVIAPKMSDGFVAISLQPGTSHVSLELAVGIVAEYAEIDGTKYVSFSRGVLLLAEDSCLCGDCNGYGGGAFAAIPKPIGKLLASACGELTVTDYASAGRTHPGTDTFRVWIPVKNHITNERK